MDIQGDVSLSREASKHVTASYYKGLEQNPAPAWMKLVFWVIISSVREEIVGFTKGFPQMEEWVGPIRWNDLNEFQLRVGKRNWVLAGQIDRDDIEYDHWDILARAIQGMAAEYPAHLFRYFVDLCFTGLTTTSYDGSNFFDDSHENGDGSVWRNYTTNGISAAEWELMTERLAMIRNPRNKRPLGINISHIFYGARAETAVKNLMKLDKLDNGKGNIHFDAIPAENRIRVDEFGYSGAVFAFDLRRAMQDVKPFILKINNGLNMIPFDKPDEWIVATTRKLRYLQDSVDEAAHFLPEVAYAFTNGEDFSAHVSQ